MSNVPQQPSQPSPPPAPPPNNAVWWILGIAGAGIVVLILLGLSLAGMILRRVNISNSGNRVAIETPAGSIHVNKSAHATGLPVYPGATALEENGNASVEIGTDEAHLGIAAETYRCMDRLDQVQAWYEKRLGSDFHIEASRDAHHAKGNRSREGARSTDHDVAFVDDRGDGARIVALDRAGSGTKITLLIVGERRAQ
jgi:hypothetical protein